MTKADVGGIDYWDRSSDGPPFQVPALNLHALCHCSCNGDAPNGSLPREDGGFSAIDALGEHVGEFCVEPAAPPVVAHAPSTLPPPKPPEQRCLVSYRAAINLPLMGPPVRVGEVLHVLVDEEPHRFEKVKLSLHINGFTIMPLESRRQPIIMAWSPFSLVQACRLHNTEADAAIPWLRLFKVSVFHHGATHFLAVQGEAADGERARWVADIARAIRALTQSLFPPFSISTAPLMGARWTATRLMAGFMVMCNNQDVCLTYCELHAQRDCEAAFVAYRDEYCDSRIAHCNICIQTAVSERVGVDCSCFSVDGHHFCTRSSAEKTLWLRAISNIKVKLRHNAGNPSDLELAQYRAAIHESLNCLKSSSDNFARCALLPRQTATRQTSSGIADRSHSRTHNDTSVQELGGEKSHPVTQRCSVPCKNSIEGGDEASRAFIGSNRQHSPRVGEHSKTVGKPINVPCAKLTGPMSKPPQPLELVEGFELQPEAALTNGSSDGSVGVFLADGRISLVSEAKYSPRKLAGESGVLEGGRHDVVE